MLFGVINSTVSPINAASIVGGQGIKSKGFTYYAGVARLESESRMFSTFNVTSKTSKLDFPHTYIQRNSRMQEKKSVLMEHVGITRPSDANFARVIEVSCSASPKNARRNTK